jgi:transcriptional regulator with XRE-family HTH domain
VDERVDNRAEVREFLTSRRARVTPERAGLPTFGGSRRVKGLRRGEVAQLAGVSVEYYTRLERGNLQGASESVLDAIARALLLDDAERTHLFDLARAVNTSPRTRRRTAPQRVRPGIQRVVDAITAPAWVRNGRSDFMACNRLARALYAPVFGQDHGYQGPSRPANTARFAFLDPRARSFYVEWERTANDIVAVLRAEAGRNPYDRGLTDLVGELSTRSDEFRTRWAAHDVQFHRTGFKRLRHPVVGHLDLTYEAMEFPSDPGLTLLVYTAEPSSPTADALTLLASWVATVDQDQQADHQQQGAPAPAPDGT